MMKAALIAVVLFSGVANAQTYHCDVVINKKDMYYVTAKVDDHENQFTAELVNKRDKVSTVIKSPVLQRSDSGTLSIFKDKDFYMSKVENGTRGYVIVENGMEIYLVGCE
ncbi:hypothetical protein D5R38_18670 [Serratia marcescens]|uniref:hypothetical protein n=1 Tax=Serratia marcescens TaxID=615 RepID=UPI00106736E5|nr:hypothetical protein [Serratia marcescens]TEW83395.1 hypothetical protein D5R38_18670 [Serratia marcescens]